MFYKKKENPNATCLYVGEKPDSLKVRVHEMPRKDAHLLSVISFLVGPKCAYEQSVANLKYLGDVFTIEDEGGETQRGVPDVFAGKGYEEFVNLLPQLEYLYGLRKVSGVDSINRALKRDLQGTFGDYFDKDLALLLDKESGALGELRKVYEQIKDNYCQRTVDLGGLNWTHGNYASNEDMLLDSTHGKLFQHTLNKFNKGFMISGVTIGLMCSTAFGYVYMNKRNVINAQSIAIEAQGEMVHVLSSHNKTLKKLVDGTYQIIELQKKKLSIQEKENVQLFQKAKSVIGQKDKELLIVTEKYLDSLEKQNQLSKDLFKMKQREVTDCIDQLKAVKDKVIYEKIINVLGGMSGTRIDPKVPLEKRLEAILKIKKNREKK